MNVKQNPWLSGCTVANDNELMLLFSFILKVVCLSFEMPFCFQRDFAFRIV